MNRIINYCTKTYPFKFLFENLFDCELEKLHFKFNIDTDINWDAEKKPGGGLDVLYEQIYPFPFQSLYDDFLKNVINFNYILILFCHIIMILVFRHN